ncbi:MAG: ArnT family glycosyltransferase [Candidatus Levyibacteriota bacterium]
MPKIIKNYWYLFCLFLFAVATRLYNLNWGAPFYFHPDERNIASAITQLSFPTQMNPHFFAYGSFPLYIVYFVELLLTRASHSQIDFSLTIILLRFASVVLSLGILFFLYKIGEDIHGKAVGFIAATLGATSIGFIQYSHFGTFEMWITFFTILLFFLCLRLIKHATLGSVILVGCVLGILFGIKVSNLFLAPLPAVALFFHFFHIRKHTSFPKLIWRYAGGILVLFSSALLSYIVTNPFALLDTTSFLSSIQYESNVATGSLPVFYTGGFLHTIPILYQLFFVYPFILNPAVAALSLASFLFFAWICFTKKTPSYVMLLFTFFLLFLSQAFLFVKWIRYLIPTLPFIYLFTSIVVFDIAVSIKKRQMLFFLSAGGICIVTFFALSYFFTAYGSPNTSVSASLWATHAMPRDARIISEVYDLGIVPFNQYFSNITLFNFYELDNHSPVDTIQSLSQKLSQTDYIILPSQRILRNRILDAHQFPIGNRVYTHLFDGSLGFEKIYQTPCDVFCKISYRGDPIFALEETATVFDRPTLFIFQNVSHITEQQFETVLQK